MGDIRATEGVGLVTTLTTSPALKTLQAITLAAYSISAEALNTEGALVNAAIRQNSQMKIPQANVMVLVRSRAASPKVKAWTFTLDGHDFYVLRLGDTSTLVYDVYSEQWMDWYSADSPRLRITQGINWLGAGAYAAGYGSNIVAGDDTYGVLWFLDPNAVYDDDPRPDIDAQLPFTRKAIGQVSVPMRQAIPCYEVYLSADTGYASGDIVLYTSDDNGNTYNDQGTITATIDDYNQEFVWRSLGQIRDPGRLFLIEDTGALKRINNFDMSLGSEG